MRIHLPNSAFLGNIDPFLSSFDPSNPDFLEITANEKWISVHPMILSMVTALGLTIEPQNIQCAKFTAKSKNYVSRMKLFETLRIPFNGDFTEHEASGRFIPLRVIQNTQEKTQLITDIIPLLHLQSEPEQAKTIGYIITELVDNVLEHACTPIGAIICAQYYQKTNCIRIGIADTGRGIKEAINQSHPASTHVDAIQLALWPGITGTTKREGGTAFNAGAGLFFVKSIASVNRDFFVIYSGNALYKMLKKSTNPQGVLRLNSDPFKDRHSKNSNLPFWKGTVVGIDITLDQTRELLFLLKAIRKTYGKSVKERTKARYKAKFI
jgi:anti-sigma regulatory factor (Ser/Thr protein kinase)